MKTTKVYTVPKVFVQLAEIALRTVPKPKSAKDRRSVANALKVLELVKRRG